MADGPPVDPRLAFVGIDQPTYESFYDEEQRQKDPALKLIGGPWPWSREVWSILIERLIEGGARVVALDIVFANPGQGDDLLKVRTQLIRLQTGFSTSATTS